MGKVLVERLAELNKTYKNRVPHVLEALGYEPIGESNDMSTGYYKKGEEFLLYDNISGTITYSSDPDAERRNIGSFIAYDLLSRNFLGFRAPFSLGLDHYIAKITREFERRMQVPRLLEGELQLMNRIITQAGYTAKPSKKTMEYAKRTSDGAYHKILLYGDGEFDKVSSHTSAQKGFGAVELAKALWEELPMRYHMANDVDRGIREYISEYAGIQRLTKNTEIREGEVFGSTTEDDEIKDYPGFEVEWEKKFGNRFIVRFPNQELTEVTRQNSRPDMVRVGPYGEFPLNRQVSPDEAYSQMVDTVMEMFPRLRHMSVKESYLSL